jgi:hypothetical protein
VPITSISLSHRRSGLVAATMVAAAVLPAAAVGGCAAGFDAQTIQPYQAAEGTNAESGPVAVRNLLVLADAEGEGVVHAAIVNTGSDQDTLTGIEPGRSEQGVKVTGMRTFPVPASGSLVLPPETGKPVTLTGAEPGEMVELTLTFGAAAPLTVPVPVLAEDHYSPTPREGGH